jgi:YD repeat-containing protein
LPAYPGYTWSVDYGPANPSWSDCTTCIDTKTVVVTDPNNDKTRYTFGTRYLVSEGLLQQTDSGWDGSNALRTTKIHYRSSSAGPYPVSAGQSDQHNGDGDISTLFIPQDQRITTQQGASFTWQADANSFDTKARPNLITKSSSLGHSRIEKTTFQDFAKPWVLGQIANVTEQNTGLSMVSNVYDNATANLLNTSHFGHLDQSMTYYADGTLNTRQDGKSQTTTFSNYKRGLAQNVSYPNNTSESAVVNDIGLITSTTDANGFTTTYQYDSVGRLSTINYPANDSVNWTPTTFTYEQITTNELGVAPNHWRETVSTGNAKTVTYLDAFWRPVVTSTYDAANPDSTQRMSLQRYDYRSKPTFESYPQRSIASINDNINGIATSYDALGRSTQVNANSELGTLTSTMSYITGFKKTITNPRGYAMTTSYQAFDEPVESTITRMDQPKGINVVMARDVFGKTLSITRSGPNSSMTRSYVYDANQRLCKIIDPEIGATMQDYDAANNVLWRAVGLPTLLSTTQCGYSNVPAERRINYGYDALNRLTSTAYADGSPAITRTYTPDGLPNTITSDGAVWTHSYNKRRFNERESLSYAGTTYNLDHSYDALGSLTQLKYPDGSSVDYAPNALGEASKVGSYASNISYFPSGAVSGFTYGNGVTHTLTQNMRMLPKISQDAGVVKDEYGYDENGNVTAITDWQEAKTNRTMSYDELDRLSTTNAPLLWGNATYTYDPQDNLIQSVVGTRTINHNFDSNNRLMALSSNTAGYSQIFSYDIQGNLSQRGSQAFTFDQGNRLRSATGKASYNYDGLGRRVKIANNDSSSTIQVYSAAGQLLYGMQKPIFGSAVTTKYVYLRHGLIAEAQK